MAIGLRAAIGWLMIGSGAILGCTVEDPEVNDPQVNQDTGDDDNVVIECQNACDETRVDCSAACDDDSCTAECTSAYDDCVTECDS
jgi:hypothetical protein